MAGVTDPLKQIDFVELHDAYTSSEIQTYEDLALCKYGDGGKFVEAGYPFMTRIDYGMNLPMKGTIPVNPSGGLDRLRTPGRRHRPHAGRLRLLADAGEHQEAFGSSELQLKKANRGLIHSHAGTGRTSPSRSWNGGVTMANHNRRSWPRPFEVRGTDDRDVVFNLPLRT